MERSKQSLAATDDQSLSTEPDTGTPRSGASGTVVGRLAPSPSARMHVGNLFSSLVAWLSAKQAGGRVVLRIEDLDRQRCKPAFADAIMHDYERLGLVWDNEEVIYQGDRTEAYEAAFDALHRRDLLYPCFCSRADLHSASAPHHGEKYIYAGTCRHLTSAEIQEKARTRHPAWRLKVDGAPLIRFTDRFQGRYEQVLSRDCGDYIVRRSDGVFAYQLAVVVDDVAQGVNQVVRGCDLLDSAPQQIYLRHLLFPDALTYSYGHVPLFVDREGRRLSKRDGDASLDGQIARFGSIEALYGALSAATGIMPDASALTLEDLLHHADLSKLCGKTHIIWE